MTAKPDDDLDAEARQYGMASVSEADQKAMIAYHKQIAADPRVPKADRDLAKARANALARELRRQNKSSKKR